MMYVCFCWWVHMTTVLHWAGSGLSGDSTCGLITPTRGIKRPTSVTLKKYLVGATDL